MVSLLGFWTFKIQSEQIFNLNYKLYLENVQRTFSTFITELFFPTRDASTASKVCIVLRSVLPAFIYSVIQSLCFLSPLLSSVFLCVYCCEEEWGSQPDSVSLSNMKRHMQVCIVGIFTKISYLKYSNVPATKIRACFKDKRCFLVEK